VLQNKSIINRRDRFNTSYLIPVIFGTFISCLQCFDAVGWAAGRASGLSKHEWWGAGMVICLEPGADLHTAQLMPLTLSPASV